MGLRSSVEDLYIPKWTARKCDSAIGDAQVATDMIEHFSPPLDRKMMINKTSSELSIGLRQALAVVVSYGAQAASRIDYNAEALAAADLCAEQAKAEHAVAEEKLSSVTEAYEESKTLMSSQADEIERLKRETESLKGELALAQVEALKARELGVAEFKRSEEYQREKEDFSARTYFYGFSVGKKATKALFPDLPIHLVQLPETEEEIRKVEQTSIDDPEVLPPFSPSVVEEDGEDEAEEVSRAETAEGENAEAEAVPPSEPMDVAPLTTIAPTVPSID